MEGKSTICSRCLLILLALASVMAGRIALADDNVWVTNGPIGSSVLAIAQDPNNHYVIYAGTVQNGVYKSTDAGRHWEHLEFDWDLKGLSMRTLAVDPNDSRVVYAGTSNGVLKSKDWGQTWERLSVHRYWEYWAFALHPINSSLIFAGEWLSTNAGDSWLRPESWPSTPYKECYKIDPVSPNIIYCGTNIFSDNKGLLKSTDTGQTWFSIQNDLEIDEYAWRGSFSINIANDSIIYYGNNADDLRYGNCLFKSTSGGTNWITITPDSLTSRMISSVRVSPLDGHEVFFTSDMDGVFKSTDEGITWHTSNDSLRVLRTATLEFASKVGILLGLYDDGVYISRNDGQWWERSSDGMYDAYCHDLSISLTRPDLIMVAAANGLFRSTDFGATWEYVETGLSRHSYVNSVCIDDYIPQRIYLASSRSWYHDSDSSGFYRSDNGGLSWQRLSNGLPDDEYFSGIAVSYLDSLDRRIFLTSGQISGSVYKSDDLGASWTRCQNGLPSQVWFNNPRVAPSNPNVVAVGIDDQIYISLDRGETWIQDGNLPGSPYGIVVEDIQFHPFDYNHLYVAYNYEGLFESREIGGDWTKFNNDLPVDTSWVVVSGIAINPINPLNMFVTSLRHGVFESHDGGGHWESYSAGIDTYHCFARKMMFVPHDTTRLVMASGSHSVWTVIRNEATGIYGDETPIPEKFTLTCYPNPFNSTTTISVTGGGKNEIGIYDITGRLITSLMTENGKAIWDATGFGSGVYFARLKSQDTSKAIRLVLLK